LFFYDTGLACSLLKIRSSQEFASSFFRGHLFENLMISDIFKQYFSLGSRIPIYFWRDLNGRIEVDCVINLGIKLVPIKIKSGETINSGYFDSLTKWNEIAKVDPSSSYVIYCGSSQQKRKAVNIVGWQAAGSLVEKIEKK